ncbi:MAG: hypothetical protein ACXVWF_07405 [Actinomycetota bacterium]
MAIKGKGKTRSRQPARAPRRAPVDVPPPFFLRRRVQVALSFVAGVLVVILAVWVTNGLRQSNARSKAKTQASRQRTATLSWQGAVQGALGNLGTISQGPTPPVILSSIGGVIGSLQKGTVPKGAVKALTTASGQASTASTSLTSFKLRDSIANKGFDVGQVDDFLNSQSRFQEALQLYQQAAGIAVLAAKATGADVKAIATQATAVKTSADTLLQEAWTDYQNALADGGLVQTPLGAPGVSTGS